MIAITLTAVDIIPYQILSVRKDNPAWGGKTIRQVLVNQGYEDLPCVKTCNNILKRNGCISEEESLKHKPFVRFERSKCNQIRPQQSTFGAWFYQVGEAEYVNQAPQGKCFYRF